jgi:hypothetical protein
MKQENRVLGRSGARELTESEVQAVTGGFRVHTLTLCIVDTRGSMLAGDQNIGEC